MNHDIVSESVTFELLSLTVEVDEDGDTLYRNSDGQLHCMFGPAFIRQDGGWVWYWRDVIHRVGGPVNMYGSHWLFGMHYDKGSYDLECQRKTKPEWKEYDGYIRASDF